MPHFKQIIRIYIITANSPPELTLLIIQPISHMNFKTFNLIAGRIENDKSLGNWSFYDGPTVDWTSSSAIDSAKSLMEINVLLWLSPPSYITIK